MNDSTDYTRAERLLARRDPVLARIIARHRPCGLAAAQREDPFQALVEAIVWQQLSTKAAATIFGRFLALFPPGGFPAPSAIAVVSDEQLRAVGFSRQKIGYLRDLCARLETGTLNLDGLDEMSDDDVIARLTQVKGIGRWSAEMVLIFRLHRLDVLPVDDLGILKAIQRAYRLRSLPEPDRVRRIGERWKPYRSVASWYLWASLENVPLAE